MYIYTYMCAEAWFDFILNQNCYGWFDFILNQNCYGYG